MAQLLPPTSSRNAPIYPISQGIGNSCFLDITEIYLNLLKLFFIIKPLNSFRYLAYLVSGIKSATPKIAYKNTPRMAVFAADSLKDKEIKISIFGGLEANEHQVTIKTIRYH